MSLTVMGDQTKTIFLKGVEAHKLHHEFTVGSGNTVIKKGQPVVLNNDGTVKPAVAGEKGFKVIGISLHNGKAGELVTIAMKAYGVLYAMPKAALVAGPVKYDGLNTTDADYTSYAAASADGSDLVGWALDQADGADDLIRVAIV